MNFGGNFMGTSAVLDLALWGSLALSFIGIVGMLLVYRRSAQPDKPIRSRTSEAGNIFFALFGAVALIAILGGATMSFMKGPLATSVKLTKMNSAETQMSVGAQIAVMASANQANNGDCDLDGYVEPIEWRPATTEPSPAGGGLIPMTVGISKKDPWGTEYGYCVWNHGTITSGSGCNANLLAGTNSKAYQVASLVSAGPDKAFTTTCRTFATADVNSDGDLLDAGDLALISKAAETDDDIIFSYTYDEATGASGGLWSIKSGDPGTAVIGKNIEATGTASLQGGVLLPDKSLVSCDPTTAGVMAMNGNAIEICDGAGNWTAITGGGTIDIVSTTPDLFVVPMQENAMDVAACVDPTCYGATIEFTVGNQGQQTSAALAVSLSNATNFEITSETCNAVTLDQGETCKVYVRSKATGNTSFTGTLNITADNNPFATLSGTSSGFGCVPGRVAPGGIYAACNVSGSDLIVTPSGCNGSTVNPTCAGGADTLSMTYSGGSIAAYTSSTLGALNTVEMASRQGGGTVYNPINHCHNLVYGGFDDWFLPSINEYLMIYPHKVTLNFANADYWSSNQYSSNPFWNYVAFLNGTTSSGTASSDPGQSKRVRCARRDPYVFPSPSPDDIPNAVTFTLSSGTAPAVTRTSNTVTISGVVGNIDVSLSGGTNPQVSKNGGAYTAGPVTVTNGDTITLRATSPVSGIEETIIATLGSGSASWRVRTVTNGAIARIFVTSGTYTGARGGLVGADATCTSVANAAGLPGSWVAVMLTNGMTGSIRLPWNWTQLRNMQNQLVATSIEDFLDGTISNSFAYTQTGAGTASWYWSAFGPNTSSASTYDCSTWSSGGGGSGGTSGSPSTLTGYGYLNGDPGNFTTCGNTLALACMENVPYGGDTTPDDVVFDISTNASSYQTRTSNTVAITGISESVSISISGGIGAAYSVNGGGYTAASGTIAPGSTLRLRSTSPNPGNSSTIYVTVGSKTFSWIVRTQGNNYIRVFTTSGTYSGVYTNQCSTLATAAGLPGTWSPLITSGALGVASIANTLPWNWVELRNMNGDVVATSPADFGDGTISASLAYDETGAPVTGSVWTGHQIGAVSNLHCGGFAGNTGNGNRGSSVALTAGQYMYSGDSHCGGGLRYYCYENTPQLIPSGPSPNDGYFVITETTYTGNLGGRAGADGLCLTELTTKDWLGKATATANGQLDAAHVKAFLCDASVCTSLAGSSAYYFAAAGLPATGGAYFVTDSGGNGPNDLVGWSGSNYFGSGAANYWSGRAWGGGNNTIWPSSPNHSNCLGFTNGVTAPAGVDNSGMIGRPASTNNRRWSGEGWSNTWGYLESTGCGNPQKLICAVNP